MTRSRTRSASPSIGSTPRPSEDLVMIDPWPGVEGDANRSRRALAGARERASRRGFHALVYYWVGWSYIGSA